MEEGLAYSRSQEAGIGGDSLVTYTEGGGGTGVQHVPGGWDRRPCCPLAPGYSLPPAAPTPGQTSAASPTQTEEKVRSSFTRHSEATEQKAVQKKTAVLRIWIVQIQIIQLNLS